MAYTEPLRCPYPQNVGGGEKSPSDIAAKQLEINENIIAQLRTYRLAMKWCNEQLRSFHQSPESVNGLITIAVMTRAVSKAKFS